MHRVYSSIPGVKLYIDSQSREQVAKDVEIGESCAICMEDFSVGGQKVVELTCSNKHIFHAECLK